MRFAFLTFVKSNIIGKFLFNSLLIAACGGAGGGNSSGSNPVKQTTVEVGEEKQQLQKSERELKLPANKAADIVLSASRSESDLEIIAKLSAIEEKRRKIVDIDHQLSTLL